MSASNLPPLHDPRRPLPCPLASCVWRLEGDLLVAPRGHLDSLYMACRRAADAADYALEHGELERMERDALVHFASMVETLRGHVLTVIGREIRWRYVAAKLAGTSAVLDEPVGGEVPS